MARFLERLLNLQRGDLGRGALLFAYLFLIMSSYMVARVTRDALFLDQFKAIQLPYADLAIAVLVGFVVSGYLFLGRNTTVRNLLIGSLVFMAANCLLFWWLAHFYRWRWLFPVIYIWVGIFGVLGPAQVWTLANYVLTTREAKRVFGLVGSGSIAGAIVGAKFSNIAAPIYGTENLLLAMALAIGACAYLVVWIWRQKEALATPLEEAEDALRQQKSQTIRESLKLIWSGDYIRAIAALILIASIVTSVAGWQFKAIAKQFIPQKDHLAAFFGDFYFYAGLAGLLVQLLITSRLLRRYGLGPALFVVPTALVFGSGGVLVWASLLSAIMLRAGINVLQYSIDKPSVELLYLPVPVQIKNQVKSFIDTVIWRFGDGLAAIATLLFATTLGWSAARVSWVNIVLIAGWFAAAALARRRYVVTLRESIQQHRLDAERAHAPVLDRSATDIIVANLAAADPKEILYALSLFETGRQPAAHPAVRDLLSHPSPEVRRKAVGLLAAAKDRAVLPRIEKLLHDPDLGVRTEALLYLTYHANIDPLQRISQVGNFPDFSIRAGMVAFLARPGPAQGLDAAQMILDGMVREEGPGGRRARLEAARLLSILPNEFEDQLRVLLADSDSEVVRHAIRAVGNLQNRRPLLRLIERLGDVELAPDVVEALAKFGDRVVGTLRDHLTDPGVPLPVRREIPSVLLRIATAAAARVLEENLFEPDTELRFRIISVLNKLKRTHPELEVDRQMVETVLAAEILGHYRSYQILGTMGSSLESDDSLIQALRESMTQEIERIFRLLGLLFPQYDLHSAYVGLQSHNPTIHANALEFLDNVLKPQLRDVLVPVVDGGINVGERIALANRLVGSKVENREEAVAALVGSDDPWLKSCGAYAIGSLGLKSLEQQLDLCLNHPDPLLRETARQAKLRLAALPGM